jgi:hypothetical protein
MRYLIGIDDTDNLETRGTGHRVRQLADWLNENRLAEPVGITRHQLLVDPQIPYTSHNSSACLAVHTETPDEVWEASREFLLRECAPGSDAGLCLAARDAVNECVRAFARRAKIVVLTMNEAEQTARQAGLRLEGLTGTHGGVIGALAGVGLHHAGNDGRFLWLPGLRELRDVLAVSQICRQAHVDLVQTRDGISLSPQTPVHVGEWVRPILRNGQAVLLVEEKEHEWHIISKEDIKRLSN